LATFFAYAQLSVHQYLKICVAGARTALEHGTPCKSFLGGFLFFVGTSRKDVAQAQRHRFVRNYPMLRNHPMLWNCPTASRDPWQQARRKSGISRSSPLVRSSVQSLMSKLHALRRPQTADNYHGSETYYNGTYYLSEMTAMMETTDVFLKKHQDNLGSLPDYEVTLKEALSLGFDQETAECYASSTGWCVQRWFLYEGRACSGSNARFIYDDIS